MFKFCITNALTLLTLEKQLPLWPQVGRIYFRDMFNPHIPELWIPAAWGWGISKGRETKTTKRDAWLPTCRAVAKHWPQCLPSLFSLLYTLKKSTLSCNKLLRSSPSTSPRPPAGCSYTTPCKDFENLPVTIREKANYYFPSTCWFALWAVRICALIKVTGEISPHWSHQEFGTGFHPLQMPLKAQVNISASPN